MKFRVQYPLWNIIGFIPLLLIGWGIIYLEGVDKDSSFGVTLQTAILIGIVLLAIFSVIYTAVIIRHNKKYPTQKVNPFRMRPNEFVEDDEMFIQLTMRATKKVYSFIY